MIPMKRSTSEMKNIFDCDEPSQIISNLDYDQHNLIAVVISHAYQFLMVLNSLELLEWQW